MAEEAAAADLISGGRLQLGISRGSPEPALRGSEAFGFIPPEGHTDADLARDKTELFRAAIAGAGVARADPGCPTRPPRCHPAAIPRPARADLVGLRHPADRRVDGRAGHEPDELDAPDRGHRRAVRRAPGRADPDLPRGLGRGRLGPRAAGLGEPQRPPDRERPRPRVLRQRARNPSDQVGYLDGGLARFGKSYVGEPDAIAEDLAPDAAVHEADTLLCTVPNLLGVDDNARLLESITEARRPGDRLAAPGPARAAGAGRRELGLRPGRRWARGARGAGRGRPTRWPRRDRGRSAWRRRARGRRGASGSRRRGRRRGTSRRRSSL